MESNFRTGLSDFYCFFYCMGEKWKIKADKYAGSNNFIKEGEQLENYTKYQLKSNEELSSLLEVRTIYMSLPVTSASRNLMPLTSRTAMSF